MSEMSSLGRNRLTSVQQLGRGLQQDGQARKWGDALSRLWDDLNSSIRAREQVRHSKRIIHMVLSVVMTFGERTEVLRVCPVSSRVCSQQGKFISLIMMWTS